MIIKKRRENPMKKFILLVVTIILVFSFTSTPRGQEIYDKMIEAGVEFIGIPITEANLEETDASEVPDDMSGDMEVSQVAEIVEENIGLDSNLAESVTEDESTAIVYEITPLEQWDTARLDYFLPYYEEPTSFTTYDDYFNIFCYMLLNHVDTYEFTIEDPDYSVDKVYEILEEDVVTAYTDVTLFLNTYTDFWSRFTGQCQQAVNEDGELLYLTYTFTLTQKDGMDSEEVEEKLTMAEDACFDIVNAMFEEGVLTSEMTEKERAYVLYQWIGENVNYDYDTPDAESDDVKHDNCYDAIIEKCAVCQGITGAYVYLCRLAGVEMYVQLGYTEEGAHSWCKIEVEDGEWMYIDPTWALSTISTTGTYTDKWFWVTQEYMETYEGNTRVFTDYVD